MKLIKLTNSVLLFMLIAVSSVFGENDGSAGTHHNFSHGVGARALALGNAYVALPFDATAIYWNPSGLDHIQYKSATTFYTNWLGGTSYYFLGYVHPTISIGSFGVGIMGYSIDGIEKTDDYNFPEGTSSVSEQMFLFSYGKQLPWNLSVGINLKIQHQNLLGFGATGVGTDVGVLYRPDFTHSLLSGLSVGVMIQNLVGPRLKADVDTDVLPVNMKLGVAKPILKNEWGPALTVFFDIEQGQRAPFKYHAGTEYVFQNMAMLRVGMNNSQLSFGAGAKFEQFHLDYSYGKFAEHELSASHRISFTVNFGKNKKDLIRIAEERRLLEIREKVDQELYMERQQKIAAALEEGKAYLEAEDYARAIREFNFIIKFEGELPGDLIVEEAKGQLKVAEQKSYDQLEQNIKETQARDAQEKRRSEEKFRLNQLHAQALAYFEKEDYERAIREWKKMLEISPDNPLANEHIAKAEADLERKLLSLINRADQLARQGNWYSAIRILDSARRLNPDESKVRMIDQKVAQYDKRLNFDELYQQGYRYYRMKDFQNAMNSFEKALSYEPNNQKVSKAFFDAKARANAKKETLVGESRNEYMRGIRLFREGKFEDALTVWEELQKTLPYNKYILDSIDMAREKLEQLNRSPRQP
ncbi:hypothetical protein B6I21_00225 [candidate division KSB1 bacterium 4572_119]|nr:MAG: hypothetical protein B6I21_00225 [candidate division KSB1 bacterium 4572_119]